MEDRIVIFVVIMYCCLLLDFNQSCHCEESFNSLIKDGEEKVDKTIAQFTYAKDPYSFNFEFDENCLIQSTLNGPVRGFRKKSATGNSDVDVFLGVTLAVTF